MIPKTTHVVLGHSFIYPSIQLWMDSGSLPALGESEQCCWERGCTPLCLNPRFKYFWLMPIAGAARACANSTFTVSGNCHIASHGPCSVLRSHQQCTRLPVSPHPHQAQGFSVFSDGGHYGAQGALMRLGTQSPHPQ